MNILRKFREIETNLANNYTPTFLQGDLYYAIPKGIRCFVWFINNKCFIIDKNKSEFKLERHCFNTCLSIKNGTVLYGTKLKIKNKEFITIEKVFYYKGQKVSKFSNREALIESILRNIKNDTNFIVFCVPLFSSNYQTLLKKTTEINYNIYCIEIKRGIKYNYFINKNKFNKIKKSFLVKPDRQVDIYRLYDNNKFSGYLNIPDIKSSVYLNSIFRNIKENKDVDLIEESDDEFEDTNLFEKRGYITNNDVHIPCIYNDKLKVWYPDCINKI
jgi:hypothetical protein